jgi:DNA-binding NarL/FixJ family response regulator
LLIFVAAALSSAIAPAHSSDLAQAARHGAGLERGFRGCPSHRFRYARPSAWISTKALYYLAITHGIGRANVPQCRFEVFAVMSAVNEAVRFLIIDDHPLFREALHSAVRMAYPDVDTIEARSIGEAMVLLGGAAAFDLALLDLSMPDVHGFEGLLQLRTHHPRLPVVVVSGHEDPRVISEALSYGAAGFIPKSARKDDLAVAIRSVMEGAIYVPEDYEPIGPEGASADRADMVQRLAKLTPQQLRVLQMLRQGLLNKQIAYELQVGETTVKAHVSEILRKLNVYSRTQAVIEVSKLDNVELFREQPGF